MACSLLHRPLRSSLVLLATALALTGPLDAHIVPPEKLHAVVESYRRMGFMLGLNPVLWSEIQRDAGVVSADLAAHSQGEGERYRRYLDEELKPLAERFAAGETIEPTVRRQASEALFRETTRAVTSAVTGRLREARGALDDHPRARRLLGEARQIFAAFEHEIQATDPQAHRRLGECWLELSSALGSPGVLGIGAVAADPSIFAHESEEVAGYLESNFGDRVQMVRAVGLSPVPSHSPTFDSRAALPVRLPPGANLNKQLPRPRQVLNMATRGVDEGETPLIALGDMVFDSPFVFGEPARSLGLSCNSCHNKSITNPTFFIPGLSARPGGLDVSNAFFAPHANNGLFDPLDIPDLRGIRFTAPYGRNGRFDSLREFSRNVIVNEFNGPEPDPMLLDGIVAYMLEFDFLPNPFLERDGRLTEIAPAGAHRGEEIFHRPFPGMGDRSCASCHVASDHFLDRKRHDIGSVGGAEEHSRDGALDTPTLLSSRYTAPYFHDGSLPTLEAVTRWFDERFGLALSETEIADLTLYLETVGEGVEAYEDTLYTLEAELEEFSFFLSAWETLRDRRQVDLAAATFRTIAFEIRAHKWDVQDPGQLPVLDRLAELMDEADAALAAGDDAVVAARVDRYRQLYAENAEVLR